MNLISLLFLFFAGQGVFLSFLLSQQKKIKSNPWISIYFFCFSIIMIAWVIYWSDVLDWRYKMIGIAVPCQLSLGPLLYLTINAHKNIKYKLIHFVPAFLFTTFLIPGWVSLFYSFEFIPGYFDNFKLFSIVIHYATLTIMLVYIIFSWMGRSSKEHTILTVGLFVFMAGYLLYNFLTYHGLMTNWIDYILATTMAVSFYAAGYYYLIKYKPYSGKIQIDQEELGLCLLKIEAHLKGTSSYLDSDYKIENLSSELEESAQKISMAISSGTAKNFKEYLNALRIEHAKKLLVSSDLKILAVALESGYNNKVSFIQNFKKFCHMTPSEFRDFKKATTPGIV